MWCYLLSVFLIISLYLRTSFRISLQLIRVGYLLGPLFVLERGGNKLFRNVTTLLLNYLGSHPRRRHSPQSGDYRCYFESLKFRQKSILSLQTIQHLHNENWSLSCYQKFEKRFELDVTKVSLSNSRRLQFLELLDTKLRVLRLTVQNPYGWTL
jgi:hypothetical protein